jgi:hypothetical protein
MVYQNPTAQSGTACQIDFPANTHYPPLEDAGLVASLLGASRLAHYRRQLLANAAIAVSRSARGRFSGIALSGPGWILAELLPFLDLVE